MSDTTIPSIFCPILIWSARIHLSPSLNLWVLEQVNSFPPIVRVILSDIMVEAVETVKFPHTPSSSWMVLTRSPFLISPAGFCVPSCMSIFIHGAGQTGWHMPLMQ